MEQCPVCGNSYGITHSCPGPRSPESSVATTWLVPTGFSPLHYFRQAVAIARLDDGAVMSASRDKYALLYGAAIWVISQLLTLTVNLWAGAKGPTRFNLFVMLLTFGILIVLSALLMLAQYAVCHLLARLWFGARGTYLGVIRPLLLGSVIVWLAVIPFIGLLIAGIWSIAVMMIVFEDVDGIGRLKAFGLSAVVGVFFQAVVRGIFAAGFGI
jgi:hypothetical protein